MEPRAVQPEHRNIDQEDERPRAQSIPVRHLHHGAASPIVHVLKTAIMLSPLVASEFIKDPSRTYKWSRIAIGGATLLDQVDYALRCARDKEREQSWVDRSRSQEERREYHR